MSNPELVIDQWTNKFKIIFRLLKFFVRINIKGLAIFLFACFYCHMTIYGILGMCKENITFKVKRRGQSRSYSTQTRCFEYLRCNACVVRKLTTSPGSLLSVICIVWIVAWLMNDGTIKMPHSKMYWVDIFFLERKKENY